MWPLGGRTLPTLGTRNHRRHISDSFLDLFSLVVLTSSWESSLARLSGQIIPHTFPWMHANGTGP